ncbi:response regulator containing a CheY-like receiver domain and an HTH DNA-binding domain [Mycolicibacterium chubuense NBB4]|uniref:Response regulator containing a CheY-like receiver domain and an HTH DNA-binding domain n=1 Tax=Mycolicibacterium chubuense (strain NBB4) TaxID=710421 RepID=I4BPV6_MYCCN|nr:response regulator transcription factor [Mycolicibacterium chubuense]AFM19313.1 response regulator containing a CheY-like receiver domain and an HTH DNA-binding domain [Mycolicibacterium chubuense NBB4]
MLLDDCAVHREALAVLLRQRGVGQIREAWDLPSYVSVLAKTSPSVILLSMDSEITEQLLRVVATMRSDIPVIAVMTSELDEAGIVACAEAGIAGYHMRNEPTSVLLSLIGEVIAGGVRLPPRVSAILLRRLTTVAARRQTVPCDMALTSRELEILRMLEEGRSNQDIADELGIALHTVKNHVHNLFSKLGVRCRAEAATLAKALRMERYGKSRMRARLV